MDFTLDQWYADQQKYAEMVEQEDEQQGNNPDQIFHPKTEEEYDKIPPGGIYVDPKDGQMYQKHQPEQPTTGDVPNIA